MIIRGTLRKSILRSFSNKQIKHPMKTPSNPDNLQKRLTQLRQEIHYHNYRYHVLDDPIISDFEYDQLMIELRAIEAEHPEWITEDSPTQRVGGEPAEKFVKVNHPGQILSLANAFDANGVREWYDRINKLDNRVRDTDFVVEPKIDGLTVVLHYRDGVFSLGATRGDGEIGEDITRNLRTVRALPIKIPVSDNYIKAPNYLVVRGEVFITIKDFERLNRQLEEEGEKTYLNPRNTASGSLRQLNPSLTANRPLTLLTYEIVSSDGQLPNTHLETLSFLRSLGFPVVEDIHCLNVEEAIVAYDTISNRRDTLPYEADGVVIKINRLDLAADLGYVGRDPRGAIAYKFPAREVTTTLLDIGVNVGRTGVLTPLAILEPINIGGVIVKQATLHNFDYIEEKDIRIGDRVAVKRAGDVIPYIIGPIEAMRIGSEKKYIPPEKCPACMQPVEHCKGEVYWYCVNAACPAQLNRNLDHFVSKGAMDIVGMGTKIVEQLTDAGLVHDVADIYQLKRADFLRLEGFADKKADNLISAIMSSKGQSLARLINALGIRGVGEVVARDLANTFHSLDQLSQLTVVELQMVEGIGPNIAQAIVDWFDRPMNRNVLKKLQASGVWPQQGSTPANTSNVQTLADYIFVVTGTLVSFSREDVKKYIEDRGGIFSESVSKKTSFLVLGENPGSKLEKARSLDIKIIDEVALRKLGG